MMTTREDLDEITMAIRGGDLPECESIVLEAHDVDAARAKAADLWHISADDIDYEIIEESSRLFGLLGKKVKVRVTSKRPIMYLQARNFVAELMKMCELNVEAVLQPDCRIDLEGEDSAIIIGRHGDTLKAFEFLTNLMFRPDQSMPKIRFDCGGYKDRREESLIRLAKSTAREVQQRGAEIRLEPMSSWERRIIHIALQNSRSVQTSSEGEEPERRVVISPNGRQRGRNFGRRRRS